MFEIPFPHSLGAESVADTQIHTAIHTAITSRLAGIEDSFFIITLAASLHRPKDAVTDAMFMFGLGEKLNVLSRKYSQYKYECFCNMADYLQVSRTALAYRMERLGLLERNLLVEEALKRKGVA